jgi:hypothetical protein
METLPAYSASLTPNSYCMSARSIYYYLFSAKSCNFDLPNGDNGVPKRNNGLGNVAGCGLLLNPKNKLSIFFTLYAILLGKF